MKTLWKKTPAWIKAIVLNALWLYPILFIVNFIIQTNLGTNPTWGWGLLPVMGLLAVFCYLTKKVSFHTIDRIRLDGLFANHSTRSWLSIFGVISTVLGISLLSALVFDIQSSAQLVFIGFFRSFTPQVAIPLLVGLALYAGVVEEVIYRGIMHNALSNYSRWISHLLVALLFTAAHFLPLLLVLPYMVISVIFSVVAEKWKSTLQVIIAHFFVDLIVFLCIYFQTIDLANLQPYHIAISLTFIGMGSLMLFFGLKTTNRATSNSAVFQVQ